jgi:hypothetical protein
VHTEQVAYVVLGFVGAGLVGYLRDRRLERRSDAAARGAHQADELEAVHQRIDRLEERHAQEMADMTARILELHELVLSTVIDIRDRVAGLEGLVAGYMRPDNAKPARRRTG